MKLIFVYNANSGVVSTVRDIGHKLLSPQTYDCFLCSLTHGTFREDPKWKAFRENSSIEMEFLHRDEFERKYDRKEDYPVVLRQQSDTKVVLNRDQLSRLSSLDDLIDAVEGLAVPSS